MKSQSLGVDINETIVLKGPGVTDSLYSRKVENFRAAALQIRGIKNMAASTNVPGDEIFWANGIRRLVGGPENSISGYTVGIDHDYVPSFDLKIVAGRSFDLQHPNNKKSVMLNRAMAEALDFKDPKTALGEKVIQHDTLEIIGVLENYHQMSLKESVAPLVFRYTPDFSSFFAFKVEGKDYQRILTSLEEPWKTYFPGNPMDYFFLDRFFNRQYESDRQFGQVFTIFTGLAIFIACLGLFGLASFMTIQRTKEIGIPQSTRFYLCENSAAAVKRIYSIGAGSKPDRVAIGLVDYEFLAPVFSLSYYDQPGSFYCRRAWCGGHCIYFRWLPDV